MPRSVTSTRRLSVLLASRCRGRRPAPSLQSPSPSAFAFRRRFARPALRRQRRPGGPLFRLRIVAAHRQQKHPAPIGAVTLQIFGQVDRLVVRAGPRCRLGNGTLRSKRSVRLSGAEAAIEFRVGEAAARLRHQVLQLRRQHAADVDFYARQVAHQHRHFLFARQRQQRALAENFQFGRIGRHLDHAADALAQHVAAEGLDVGGDLDVQVAAHSAPVFEAVQARCIRARRESLPAPVSGRAADSVRRSRRCSSRTTRRRGGLSSAFRIFFGQQPGRHRLLQHLLVHGGRRLSAPAPAPARSCRC